MPQTPDCYRKYSREWTKAVEFLLLLLLPISTFVTEKLQSTWKRHANTKNDYAVGKRRIIHFCQKKSHKRQFFACHAIIDKSHRNSIISVFGFIFFSLILRVKTRHEIRCEAKMVKQTKKNVFGWIFMFAKRISLWWMDTFLNGFGKVFSCSRIAFMVNSPPRIKSNVHRRRKWGRKE